MTREWTEDGTVLVVMDIAESIAWHSGNEPYRAVVYEQARRWHDERGEPLEVIDCTGGVLFKYAFEEPPL